MPLLRRLQNNSVSCNYLSGTGGWKESLDRGAAITPFCYWEETPGLLIVLVRLFSSLLFPRTKWSSSLKPKGHSYRGHLLGPPSFSMLLLLLLLFLDEYNILTSIATVENHSSMFSSYPKRFRNLFQTTQLSFLCAVRVTWRENSTSESGTVV